MKPKKYAQYRYTPQIYTNTVRLTPSPNLTQDYGSISFGQYTRSPTICRYFKGRPKIIGLKVQAPLKQTAAN